MMVVAVILRDGDPDDADAVVTVLVMVMVVKMTAPVILMVVLFMTMLIAGAQCGWVRLAVDSIPNSSSGYPPRGLGAGGLRPAPSPARKGSR